MRARVLTGREPAIEASSGINCEISIVANIAPVPFTNWPIGGQYLGHVITLDQSEASIWVMWSLSTNQRPVSR